MSDNGALAEIVRRKHAEAGTLRCGRASIWGAAEARTPARPFAAGIAGGGVIAEMKRRSPSGGELRPGLVPARMAEAYAAAGAAAISVLTDGPDFGGSLDDLEIVSRAASIPVLRKDFIVDPIQVAEARIAGADAVLLIAAILEDTTLDACLEAVRRAGIEALVEVHTEVELTRAVASGATLVGVNNRNLSDLSTDLGTFARLRKLLPEGILCVAESGVRSAADVTRLVGEGADAVLVGEVLMRAQDPAALCAELVAAART
jgi:indole-3-glycerol phosphate synthase